MRNVEVFAAPGLWIQRCEALEGPSKWFAYYLGVGVHFETSEGLLEAFDRSDVRDWLTAVN